MCSTILFDSAPEPENFDCEAGRVGQVEYGAWPLLPSGFSDTVAGALSCLREYNRRLRAGELLWITTKYAAEFSALPHRLVHDRCRAALEGGVEAWPWTRVKRHRKIVLLWLPDLIWQVFWVHQRDVPAYCGVLPSALFRWVQRGLLRPQWRLFRSVRPFVRPVWLGDVLVCRGLLQLRKLFGYRMSYDELSPLLELSPEAVAQVYFSRAMRK